MSSAVMFAYKCLDAVLLPDHAIADVYGELPNDSHTTWRIWLTTTREVTYDFEFTTAQAYYAFWARVSDALNGVLLPTE